jgi:tetratricopeptide (TPR) repeat protein
LRTPVAKRVLFVGWESADWHAIRPLLGRGVMPALAGLIDRGVSGSIAPVQPLASPMLWTSLATGKRADKHGICSYFEPLPDRSGIQPVSSTSRQCQAIWNILSSAALNSHVVNWPATYPAEAIAGSMAGDRFFSLANDDTGPATSASCYPPTKRHEWRSLAVDPLALNDPALEPFRGESDGDPQHALAFRAVLAAAATVHAVACRQLQTEPWDFAAVRYPPLPDVASIAHAGPAAEAAGAQPAELTRRQSSLEEAWRFQDKLLATLLRIAGEETTVVLVSPQPTMATALAQGLTTRRLGIACLAGPGIRPEASLQGGTILDVAPTILSLLGLPIGDDMDGWPWQHLLAGAPRIRRTPSWELLAGSVDKPTPAAHARQNRHPEAAGASSVENDAARVCNIVLRNQKTNLALALDDSNRAHLATPYWRELVAAHPDDPELSVRLTLSLLRNRELSECRRFIQQLPPTIAASPQVQLTRAQLSLHDGKLSEAARLAWEQAEQHPLDAALLHQSGDILLKCQAWHEAELVFTQALKVQADNPVARHGLATVYWEAERYDDAVREVRHALESAPAFTQARFTLARSLQSLGNDADAIEAFEDCVKMNFQPQESHGRLAALYRSRDPQRAQEHQRLAGVK